MGSADANPDRSPWLDPKSGSHHRRLSSVPPQRLRGHTEGPQEREERRRSPREDFLSAFLPTATEAGELSPEEMLYQILPLIIGSVDTTRANCRYRAR